MGTKGTLIIGSEGEVMLFTDTDKPTGIETTPKSGNAVLDASESRVADAQGKAVSKSGSGSDTGEDRLLPYRLEIATFCSAIRTGVPLRCGVERATRITAACLAANKAIETRTHVQVAALT